MMFYHHLYNEEDGAHRIKNIDSRRLNSVFLQEQDNGINQDDQKDHPLRRKYTLVF